MRVANSWKFNFVAKKIIQGSFECIHKFREIALNQSLCQIQNTIQIEQINHQHILPTFKNDGDVNAAQNRSQTTNTSHQT